MIRHQLTAQKQIFIGVLFLASVFLMGLLRFSFETSGVLSLTDDARIDVYFLGILAALLYLHRQWADLLQTSFLSAPFEGTLLAVRFAFVQSLSFTLIYFLLRDIATSRAFLIWFLLIGLPVNAVIITWLPGLLRKFFNREDAVYGIIVGKGPIPEEVIHYVHRCRHFGVDFREYYGDPQEEAIELKRRGSVSDFKSQVLDPEPGVNRVLLFGSKLEDPESESALNLCHRLGLRVQIILHGRLFSGSLMRHVVDGDAHFLTFADEPLQNPLNRLAKRCIDVVLSLLVVVFLLPPLTLVVWLVQRRQSPGPLFYRQSRHGLNREKFSILKFRTMNTSAGAEATQATVGDLRMYPFGRLLRRLSLDEVPQFLNVICGDMSMIGPRPHLTDHDELFEQEISAYRIRHFVKPGITGYAQIRGLRGEVKTPEQIHQRVQHDIYYISNWSLKLDFYIAGKTVVALLRPPDSAV